MRDMVGAELLLFARTLMLVEQGLRKRAAERILSEVDVAALHHRKFGRCHPRLGDGSLMGRCHQLSPRPEPMGSDPDFLVALKVACDALLRHSRP
ncbi:MAG: hypothetical protein C0524_12140 [Rhodobacter sp.]|nr:hypothetical protein [Rhodobacter sp.]